MKQYITLNQIKETSVNFINKLIVELHIEKYHRGAVDRTVIYSEDVLSDITSYCTVFNMIELLVNLGYQVNTSCGRSDASWVELNMGRFDELYDSKELCDALWLAILDVL